jgi:hypothetical protein
MTKEQIAKVLAERRDAHHLVQKRMHLAGITMSCLNCEYWDADNKDAACTLFKATPPPQTLVFSCVTHWIQEVPF